MADTRQQTTGQQQHDRLGNTSLGLLSREPDKEPVFLLLAVGQIESGEVHWRFLLLSEVAHDQLICSFQSTMSCTATTRSCTGRTGLSFQ